MREELLSQIKEFLEKQDILCKLTESRLLHEYGYSEIHTVQAVGTLDEPNVTEIARSLRMTRGAVSKITKKLTQKGLLEPYARPDNRQKVFFRLTPAGQSLYREHETRHQLWRVRDLQFLSQFSSKRLHKIEEFLRLYNAYLEESIQELERGEEET